MQVAHNQLLGQLQRGLKPLYMLHGDEPLLQQEAADAIRAAARAQGFTERSVFVVQGAHFKWGEVLQAGNAMSLFADKQLVDIRIPSGKPGKDGSAALQQLADTARQADGVMWIITLPRLDFASTKSAWFAALDGAGVSVKIDTIERRLLPAWIGERLKREGLTVVSGDEGVQTLQFFADCVEGNLLAAHQEIQKLSLLFGKAAGAAEGLVALSFEQVQRSVVNVARFDVFKLSEAALSGQPRRVQRMLDGLRAEGEAEVLVHFNLSDEVRQLRRVKLATEQGRPLAMALRESGVRWGKEQLYEQAVPRLQLQQLNALMGVAQATDGIVKGLKQPGLPSEPWAALSHLGVSLARACAAGQ